MSNTPQYETDVFISYNHLDNEDDWVTNFHEKLRKRLGEFYGQRPKIWRDTKRLEGGVYFSKEITDNLARAKVFVAVLSPGYLKSEWCLREIQEFASCAERSGGKLIGNDSRMIKAVKYPVPRNAHPQPVKELLDYMFYDTDPDNGRARPYSQERDGYGYQKYLDRMDDLADYIKGLLEALDRPGEVTNVQATKTVYLAETSSDLADERDAIRRELQQHGYCVLPDMKLPDKVPDYLNAVSENLKRSCMSIHLIGERFGLIPDGEEEKSIVVLQNELAAGRSKEAAGFSRLIWMPEELEAKGPLHQKFVSELQTNSNIQQEAELYRRSLEAFKSRIIEKLSGPAPSARAHESSDRPSIYLMCNKLDLDRARAAEKYLFGKGYEVIVSEDSEADQPITYHKQNVVECDATLIYYGESDHIWVRSMLWDLTKAKGWGREKNWLCKAILISSPETEHKRRFKTHEAELLPSYNGFSQAAMDLFINCIERHGR